MAAVEVLKISNPRIYTCLFDATTVPVIVPVADAATVTIAPSPVFVNAIYVKSMISNKSVEPPPPPPPPVASVSLTHADPLYFKT